MPDRYRAQAPANGGVLIEFGALDQRVQNVEKGQTALSERLDSLGAHIDRQIDKLGDQFATQVRTLTQLFERRSQPQWQMLSLIATVGIAILMAFGGLASLLMSTNTSYVANRTTENRQGVMAIVDLLRTDYMPRREVEKQLSFLEKEIADLTAAESGDLDDVRERLNTLRADSVTADAHQAVLDRLSNLENTVGDITPVGDVLKNMQDQIKRLQAWYFTERGVERPVPAGR